MSLPRVNVQTPSTPSADASPPVPPARVVPWLRGWRLCILLFALLVLATAGAMTVWFRSTADIERVRVRARELGIATCTAEAHITASTSIRLAAWQRLIALTKGMKSYHSGVPWDKRTWKGPRPGEGPHADVIAYHAALDQRRLDEMLELIDALDEGPVVVATAPGEAWRNRDPSMFREMAWILAERISLADAQNLGSEVRRAVRAMSLLDDDSLFALLMRSASAGAVFSACASRLDEVRSRAPGTASQVTRLADSIASDVAAAAAAEFRTLFESMDRGKGRNLTGDTYLIGPLSLFGHNLPQPITDLAEHLALRAGRERLLMTELAWAAFTRDHRDVQDVIVESKRIQAAMPPPSLMSIIPWAATRTVMKSQYWLWSSLSVTLQGRVLAAELANAPWPEDVFDPARHQLRRVERGGRLIGAYSVFTDGLDGHGSMKSDRCWALYEPLGRPLAGDPEPPPPSK
ncbi:MAG: hypothetical protein H0W83_15185 [Planctomycetes bacterium]|nr:hypothetical protein [Planctomycetota bacterium]